MYNFSPMAFLFADMVTIDKTLNWFTFRDYGSIFKVTEIHYVSKLTYLHNISCSFVLMAFKLSYLISIDKTFN